MTRIKRLWFWLVCSALFFLGIFFLLGIHPAWLEEWLEPEFWKAFGHALIIAAILSATVDQFVKERVVREVARDTQHYLIGYGLPDEIQNKIRELANTAIVRTGYEQHYDLKRNGKGRLKIEVKLSYEVINYSTDRLSYTPRIALEKHDNPKVHEISCLSNDDSAKFHWAENELSVYEKHDERRVIVADGQPFTVQPRPSRETEKPLIYRVYKKYSIEVPDDYSEVISFFYPTIGVLVTVECPDGITFGAPPATIQDGNRWQYDRLFLSEQHIHVRWFASQ